jgi:hypothetical protein
MSAEAIAPTMVSDGLMHYKHADLPMGEFWFNSPTHDKPNDMRDAISGAHIYGKKIIQAESFTTVRMDWSEHPGSLKVVGDRNFALGINKMVMHVFAHNPFPDRKPGVTLDGVGLYFQRDQTWFKQSKAWIEYLTRCQALLQMGDPVVDVAVFTGEEVPRRSVLPDRLGSVLPGIFGKEKVEAEKKRLENKGQPLRQIPDGVTHSANMADAEDWIDPLYDSFNPDALMLMQVKNGRAVLPGGASYGILVIPGKMLMNPNPTMSVAVQKKLQQLANAGAKMVIDQQWIKLFGNNKNVVAAPYMDSTFEKLGVKRDVEINGNAAHAIAWTHRKTNEADIYFLSNQSNTEASFEIKFRVHGYDHLEIYNPVTGEIGDLSFFDQTDSLFMVMAPGQSMFYVFRKTKSVNGKKPSQTIIEKSELSFKSNNWNIQFEKKYGGPSIPVKTEKLQSWSIYSDSSLKYYSGTAVYTNMFDWKQGVANQLIYLDIDSIYNIATVKVNGIDCGTVWTQPYSVDITKAIRQGENKVEIFVTNTWHNRLIGDQLLPEAKRITWTTAPFRLKDKPLLPAGIVGEVKLIVR